MSGGYNGGTRKGKRDIAPAMRASFLAAIKLTEQRQGKTLAELMAEWLLKDPIAMLNVISKFAVREQRVPAAHDHAVTPASFPATRKFLELYVDQDSVQAPPQSIHNRPSEDAGPRVNEDGGEGDAENLANNNPKTSA